MGRVPSKPWSRLEEGEELQVRRREESSVVQHRPRSLCRHDLTEFRGRHSQGLRLGTRRSKYAPKSVDGDALEETPLERMRRAVWGISHVENADTVSRSPDGLTKTMAVLVVDCQESGLTGSESKTEGMLLWSVPSFAEISKHIKVTSQWYKQAAKFDTLVMMSAQMGMFSSKSHAASALREHASESIVSS